MCCHPFHGLWQTDCKQGLQPPSRLHRNVPLVNTRLAVNLAWVLVTILASLTFKRIGGDHKHLASNYGEGEYPLKMDHPGWISICAFHHSIPPFLHSTIPPSLQPPNPSRYSVIHFCKIKLYLEGFLPKTSFWGLTARFFMWFLIRHFKIILQGVFFTGTP